MNETTGVFISYRRSDAPGHAGRLRDELVRFRRPMQVFMDVDSIRPGTDFSVSINTALEDTKVLLVIIGPNWAAARDSKDQLRLHDPGDFVRREVAAALDRDVLTIPVLVGGATMPSTSDLPEDLQPLAYREAIELRDSRWGRDVADLIAYLDGLVAAGPARRFSPQRPERRLLIPIAVALAVVAVIVAAVLVAPRLNDSGSDVTAQGPTTGPTSAGSPTTPTSGGPTTATEPAGDTKSPGLRKVFEGITAKRCNDRTGDWPGVNDFDAKQVIGCDFPDYTVDFHQWLNAREMQRYESAAYRTFRKWTERNTHWDGPDGHPVGDYYVWQVQGGYEILWTIDDLLMSGRMFAAVKSSDAIEKMWSNDAGVYANPKYLT